jgi:hypothetical protein
MKDLKQQVDRKGALCFLAWQFFYLPLFTPSLSLVFPPLSIGTARHAGRQSLSPDDAPPELWVRIYDEYVVIPEDGGDHLINK